MLGENTYQMFTLKPKHTQSFQYLLFHDSALHDTQMPQISEACKASFVDVNTNVVSSDIVDDLTTQLALNEALGWLPIA